MTSHIIFVELTQDDTISNGRIYSLVTNSKVTGIPTFGLTFELITNIIVTYVIYVLSILKKPLAVDTLKILNQVDNEIKSIGGEINYKRYFRYQMIRIIIGMTGIFIIGIGQGVTLNGKDNPMSSMYWLILYIVKIGEIFDLTTICDLVSAEIYEIGKAVMTLTIWNRNEVIQKTIMTFSHQLSHNRFTFNVLNLFSINLPLMINLIGSGITILVLMIQYQEAQTPRKC
ncbi:uncharacterized protein [Diabrotica undecimpunctata]|uniref:uncharacterized protein n=1 Tax=Diabrotica undecimpunctata TaxID=50387 RepID=UPI003B640BD8